MHALGLTLALALSATGLSEAELATALRGEVPTRTESFTTPAGKSSGRGVGAITIDAPIAEVWTHLTRYEDKAEYIPRLERVEVLARSGDRLRVRQTVDATVTTARYTALYQLDEAHHTIHWVLDSSARDNTIAGTDGEYRLFEVSPRCTLLLYRAWVDSGVAVPRFIQDHMARKSIPDLLRAIRARVLSGGRYRKR